ncbi:hypothetical protein, partial [Streptomyces sp. NPDC057336]|uniref:hypothetical protein n=1 Tax=Streptomyces sp. NPDC057336 TaxID=3346102 RepID=UPI00363B72B3
QRDRVRLELRRIVLHDHEMSVLRSSGSSVSCIQHQGSKPLLLWRELGQVADMRDVPSARFEVGLKLGCEAQK